MYVCGRCKEISEPNMPCMNQHYKMFEEKRCSSCYNIKAEQRFNIEKSIIALQDNLPRLTEEANATREFSFERDKIDEKITETKRRIAKAKKGLGITK